jgi:hypothetical protein
MFTNEYKSLVNSQRLKFADWEKNKKNIPLVASGTYIIWLKHIFIYAGMAGKGLSVAQIATAPKFGVKPRGLRRRLEKHAGGYRGGNQFCVYISDIFIIPRLKRAQLKELRRGKISLDGRNGLIKKFVRKHFDYQYIQMPDGSSAEKFEQELRKGLFSIGKPRINSIQNK